MSGCIFCSSEATVEVHNKGGSVRYSVCDPCYRSKKDSFVIIKREADENPSQSPGQSG